MSLRRTQRDFGIVDLDTCASEPGKKPCQQTELIYWGRLERARHALVESSVKVVSDQAKV